MDYARNIINNNSDVYLKYEYLMYPVNLNIVPEMRVGSDLFFAKNSYHISLLCLEGIPKTNQTEILSFAQKYNLKLGKITSIFRLVIEEDQQTIIVRIRLFGLKKLIFGINKNFGYKFEYPPTHITLFTLRGQTGVGINTCKRYRQIGNQISPGDIKRLEKSFKLI